MRATDLPTLYIDESGNTGPDLLQSSQPVFTLGSILVSPSHAADILDRVSRNSAAREMRFQQLKRRPSGQAKILTLLDTLGTEGLTPYGYISHKPFAFWSRLVHFLVFESSTEVQRLTTDRAVGLIITHAGWYLLQGCYGPVKLRPLLSMGQLAIRTGGRRAYRRLHREIAMLLQWDPGPENAFAREHIQNARTVLRLLHMHRALQGSMPPSLDASVLDLSVEAAFRVCVHWSKHAARPFPVVHDESSRMWKKASLWRMLTSPAAPAAEFGCAGREVNFPLSVASTELGRSQEHPGLQLADVLAGVYAIAGVRYLGFEDSDPHFTDAVIDRLGPSVGFLGLVPDPEIATSKELSPPHVREDLQAYVDALPTTLGFLRSDRSSP